MAMPTGVFSPAATARKVDADTKSRRKAHRAVPHDLALATLMDRDEEWQARKALMDRARAGDEKAHADLWRLYRCRLTDMKAAVRKVRSEGNAPVEVRMWSVIAERIRAGEPWRAVMRDYGIVAYYKRTAVVKMLAERRKP